MATESPTVKGLSGEDSPAGFAACARCFSKAVLRVSANSDHIGRGDAGFGR